MSLISCKIAIIGEGVIGMSTALAIRQALPKAEIKIFADRPFEETTSFGPAGIFRFGEKSEERYIPLANKTFDFWAKLEGKEAPINTGVHLVSGHIQSENKEYLGNIFENQDFSLIINCAGLDGGKLAGDDENVFPNRGVGIVVKAPGQSHFCYQDADTFCIPIVGDDRVLLGTLRQDNRWDREISKEDVDDIWTRVLELKPSLKNSEVVSKWCGLRPDRIGGVRLEHVIHNYGHGAKGFLLSWGCAQEVLQLIKDNGI